MPKVQAKFKSWILVDIERHIEIPKQKPYKWFNNKNGNKMLFILRNRARCFVAENSAHWPITLPTNKASIFAITREKIALSSG